MDVTNPHGINIDMDQFTTNVVKHDTDVPPDIEKNTVTGDGIFDILMTTATKHIQAQFEGGRIRGEDYATAYMQVYTATLDAAIKIWLQKPMAEMTRLSEEAKRNLYHRQIEAFDEDYKHKILKICMDSWSVGFSVARDAFGGEANELIPSPMQSRQINEIFNYFVLPDMESYKYGRDPNIMKNKVNMKFEEILKEAATTVSKLVGMDPMTPEEKKTDAQKAYNTAMNIAVEDQVAKDVADIE